MLLITPSCFWLTHVIFASTEIDILLHRVTSLKASVEEKMESETTLSEVMARRHNRYTKASKVVQLIPVIINHYELARLDGQGEQLASKQVGKRGGKFYKACISKKKKYKIITISDSHAKCCAPEVTHHLDKSFEVQGFVKPGTRVDNKHSKGRH
jgi:hypothetical protein